MDFDTQGGSGNMGFNPGKGRPKSGLRGESGGPPDVRSPLRPGIKWVVVNRGESGHAG